MILAVVSAKEVVVLVDYYTTLGSLANWAVGNPNRMDISNQSLIVR